MAKLWSSSVFRCQSPVVTTSKPVVTTEKKLPFQVQRSPQCAPKSSGPGPRSPGIWFWPERPWAAHSGVLIPLLIKLKIWMTVLGFLSHLSPTQKKCPLVVLKWESFCFVEGYIMCNPLNSYFRPPLQCPFLREADRDPQVRYGSQHRFQISVFFHHIYQFVTLDFLLLLFFLISVFSCPRDTEH